MIGSAMQNYIDGRLGDKRSGPVPMSELKDVIEYVVENAQQSGDRLIVFDDFLAAALDARWSSTAGSGTGNEVLTTVANGLNGLATLKTASDDGTHAANGTTLTMDQLNFKASQGGLAIEARLKVDAITAVAIFVGFTDVISSTVELPIFLNAADIDSDATDAAGVIFDTDGTTAEWAHGGVKAGTDTVPAYNDGAPVADTFVTVRVEIDETGAVQGFIDGVAIGDKVQNAITTSVAITPAIVVANRSAAQRVLTIDYIKVEAIRG